MMKKFGGTRYNSCWDRTTWLILGLIAGCCILPFFFDDGIMPSVVSVVILLAVIVVLLSVYYRIDGDNLVVYTFFRPKVYSIGNITEVKPTDSTISAPATSLTHRLAVTFADNTAQSGSNTLIISPVRQDEFIRQLLSVNHNISTCR